MPGKDHKQVEQALRESEVRYRTLVEHSIQGISIIQHGVRVYANAALADIFGYEYPDELIGMQPQDNIAPEDRDRVAGYRQARLRGEPAPERYEIRCLKKDRTVFWAESIVTLIPWEGAPASLTTLIDITDRKRAEVASQRSMERFSKAFHLSPTPMAITRLRDGHYIAVNESFLRTTGYAREEVLGRTSLGLNRWADPEARERTKQQLLVQGTVSNVKTRMRAKSGELRETLLSFTLIELDDEPCILAIIDDVTEHKRAEAALRASEERYRTVVEGSIQGLYIHQGGVIRFANQAMADIFGYASVAELIGQKYEILVAPHERPRLEAYRVSRLRGESPPVRYDFQGVRKDGSLLWVEIFVTLISWEGESAVLVTFLDITERKRLEAQLRQAQKMEAIGTLAGGIAHDFNNILSAIFGYTELAQLQVPKSSRAAKNLQGVLTAAERARELVRQILTFSRQREVERKPLQLASILRETLTLLRATLPASIEIQAHIAVDEGQVLADPTQIRQIVMNLCANAEYAMRDAGGVLEVSLDTVEITTRMAAVHPDLRPGMYNVLRVHDTGHGMTPEVLERIFDPFFTTKTVGQGTGMGLPMVLGMVTGHGGRITVDSTPGAGTTFTIYLPRDNAPVAGPEGAEHDYLHGTGRLLLIDDEPAIVESTALLLERLGYEVVTSTSSWEALTMFRSQPSRYQLVITDQTMPAMTGERLARELRRIRPDIPLILCTGFSHTMNAETAARLDIDAFCMKPLDVRELSHTIHRLLSRPAPEEADADA